MYYTSVTTLNLYICISSLYDILFGGNTLQHTATHCNTLQHTAAHCSTLQHTATHCNTLQHTATHYSTLHATLEIRSKDVQIDRSTRNLIQRCTDLAWHEVCCSVSVCLIQRCTDRQMYSPPILCLSFVFL